MTGDQHSIKQQSSTERPSRVGEAGELIAATIVDNAGNLSQTIANLREREAALQAEFEANSALLTHLGSAQPVTGRGSAPKDVVTVEVDAFNRITQLEIDPRALRLGSIEKLQEAVLSALEQAYADVAGQQASTRTQVEGGTIGQLLAAMPEFTALLPQSAQTALTSAEDSAPIGGRDGRQ